MPSPRIALTLGDVAGIGPEVVVRAWNETALHDWCRPVVVGHPDVVRRAVRLVGVPFEVQTVARIDDGEPAKGTIVCWNPTDDQAADVPPGQNDGRAGQAACEYLSAATEAALAGRIDAITTAPLSKAALHRAGLFYPGHTEILAELCGVREYAMMLYLGGGDSGFGIRDSVFRGQGTGDRDQGQSFSREAQPSATAIESRKDEPRGTSRDRGPGTGDRGKASGSASEGARRSAEYSVLSTHATPPASPSSSLKPQASSHGAPAPDRRHSLGVVHVTLHTSIRSVPGLLTTAGILEKIRLIDRFLRDVGCAKPRVGVCALNPHAGEEGLFGDEESATIAPAVRAASSEGIDATGPFPADTLLKRACGGEFDGVVAMYHDQGHIALKLVGFNRAVNVTLGLPIVRTSPSHGTAFDIAWQGQASGAGMVEAVRVAALLAEKKCGVRSAECGTEAGE
jgi:4-hydroxy-L-threonine phosphate dehydrogenase PdxA